MSTPLDVIEGRADWCVVTGDCLEVMAQMPDRSVAHVITDPPYSEHTHAKQRSGAAVQRLNVEGHSRRKIAVDRDLGFDALTDEQAHQVALEAARLSARWFLAFTDTDTIDLWRRVVLAADLEHIRVGAWVKFDAQPQFTGDRPGQGFEPIEIAHPSGRKRWRGGGRHAVWTFGIEKGNREHTTQKPLPLMEALVRDFTDPGEIILDPFCGSGTTGVACRRLGRRFIGVELNEKWAEVARRRIGETHEQPDLLSAESFARGAKAKRKQMGLPLEDK